jgi:hypothetical protein
VVIDTSLDAIENKKRLEEIRKKMLEAIEYIDSWTEAEAKKRGVVEPEFQD